MRLAGILFFHTLYGGLHATDILLLTLQVSRAQIYTSLFTVSTLSAIDPTHPSRTSHTQSAYSGVATCCPSLPPVYLRVSARTVSLCTKPMHWIFRGTVRARVVLLRRGY